MTYSIMIKKNNKLNNIAPIFSKKNHLTHYKLMTFYWFLAHHFAEIGLKVIKSFKIDLSGEAIKQANDHEVFVKKHLLNLTKS